MEHPTVIDLTCTYLNPGKWSEAAKIQEAALALRRADTASKVCVRGHVSSNGETEEAVPLVEEVAGHSAPDNSGKNTPSTGQSCYSLLPARKV